jgi:hypothetical protein
MALISAAASPDAAAAVDADAGLRAIGFHLGGITSLERSSLRSFPGGTPIERDVRWMLRAGIQCKLLAARLAREAAQSPLAAHARVAEARDLLGMVDGALGRVAMSVAECPETQIADAQEAQARFVGARQDLDTQHGRFRFLEAVGGGASEAPTWGEPADRALLEWSVVLGRLRPAVRRDPEGIPVLRRAVEDVFIRSLDAGAEARAAFRKAYEALLREGRGQSAAQAREAWRALFHGDLGGERVRKRDAEWWDRLRKSEAFGRGLRIGVVVGLFGVAAAAIYQNLIKPSLQFEELPSVALHRLAPELERGNIVRRDTGGDVFFGQLSAARERLAPERAPEMIAQLRVLLAPLGVREIMLVDRNNAPYAHAFVEREAPEAPSGPPP